MTKRILAIAVLLGAVLLLAVRGPAWARRADLAAGYAARMSCACHYVEERGWEGCGDDLVDQPMLRLVTLANDPDRRTVTASLPLLARHSARFEPGAGCLMVPL